MTTLFLWLQRILPQHLLSRIVGRIANIETPWLAHSLIRGFVRLYPVEMSEAARTEATQYRSFNDFFTRELLPGARTIADGIVSPADGTVSACGTITGGQLIQAKGIDYSVRKLLAHHETSRYEGGSFITIYLAPHNYHCVHMPVSADIPTARYVPGDLFSVNNTTAQNIPDLFARNERLVCDLKLPGQDGALVMVGAMIVAGIRSDWRDETYPAGIYVDETPDTRLEKGARLGHFEMGSTVILVFENELAWQVEPGQVVRMGQQLAHD